MIKSLFSNKILFFFIYYSKMNKNCNKYIVYEYLQKPSLLARLFGNKIHHLIQYKG